MARNRRICNGFQGVFKNEIRAAPAGRDEPDNPAHWRSIRPAIALTLLRA
jgi:hypothetical protein